MMFVYSEVKSLGFGLAKSQRPMRRWIRAKPCGAEVPVLGFRLLAPPVQS